MGIFTAFVAFLAAVLALMWVSQTFLMEGLYKNVRVFETRRCAEALSDSGMADLGNYTHALGGEYSICVSVYKISKNSGVCVAESHVTPNCLIHNIASDEFLNGIYEKVRTRGEVMESLPQINFRGGETASTDEAGESIIYARLVRDADGAEYMLLLNTEIYPLASTVSTMRLMLFFVSGILIIFAALFSWLLARRMARPLREMSLEAEKLALGNYDVAFKGGAYKEQVSLAETLNNASVELSQLDRMQKDLIANVSHDLRTPLTLISGYSEVMRDIPGEMTGENMQIIIDETHRLSSLVSDMLDMSQFMAGRQRLSVEEFDLTEAVHEVLGRYSKLREREGYAVDFEYTERALVRGDRTRILQVVYNLVNNAINYTGEDKRVLVRQTCLDGQCLIEVTDSGCGIPERDLPMIWERYYKVSEFHKRSPMGTGLGLSIVKSILVLHGVEFGVRSRVGVGSTFWFKLPISRGEGGE